MIESGVDRQVVTSRLRKTSPNEFAAFPEYVAKWLIRLRQLLNAANIQMSAMQVATIMAMASALLAALVLIGAALAGFVISPGVVQLAACFGLALGVLIPLMVISRFAQARRRKIESQFPIALDIFVRGLRSGHPIPSALELLTTEMEDPIGSEFGIVLDEIAYGFDLRDALFRMAERWGLTDMHMFVVSVSVQTETGGNLAEILENLSGVIRERASMFMKVRALSSEGRMTALILTALPVMAFAGLFTSNPGFYLDVAQDPMFVVGFGGLVVLYFIGFFTIRSMIDLKV
ncbi:MAG: type II secretion system F family protein [Sphingopyxis sp.]|uniref:type II secretion system F family protein n=1 Tax=Sphingopyxis sp. TaxID=1908224 RepID=UPI003D6D6B50